MKRMKLLTNLLAKGAKKKTYRLGADFGIARTTRIARSRSRKERIKEFLRKAAK
jgi:hypothetical protein